MGGSDDGPWFLSLVCQRLTSKHPVDHRLTQALVQVQAPDPDPCSANFNDETMVSKCQSTATSPMTWVERNECFKQSSWILSFIWMRRNWLCFDVNFEFIWNFAFLEDNLWYKLMSSKLFLVLPEAYSAETLHVTKTPHILIKLAKMLG